MNAHKTVGMGMLIVLASLIIATAPSVQATVITLGGGDVGEGFSPSNETVYAYNLYGSGGSPTPANLTIQGVTFLPFDIYAPPSGFSTLGGLAPTTETSFDIGASTSDDALELMGETAIYETSSFDVTLGNLTAGKTYQVDLFVFHSDGNTYGENFTFNGGQQNIFAGLPNTYYDVREQVVANGSGQIIVTMADATGLGGGVYVNFGRFNGFAVTTVPEPTTVLLLGTGGLLLWGRRRQGVRA